MKRHALIELFYYAGFWDDSSIGEFQCSLLPQV